MFKSVVITLLFIQSISIGRFQLVSGSYAVSALEKIPDPPEEYGDNSDDNNTIWVETYYTISTGSEDSDEEKSESEDSDESTEAPRLEGNPTIRPTLPPRPGPAK